MPVHKASCPSCGAPVDFRSSAALLVVCAHCRSTLLRKDMNLETIGRMADLLKDASPLQLGTEGKYQGKPFTVAGRVQMDYGEGTWNEWVLAYDWEHHAWLGEAQGRYMVTEEIPVKETLPALEGLAPGAEVVLNGARFEVIDIQDARCVGGEGELPQRIQPGFETTVVDLACPDGRFATLDYGDDPPRVYLGRQVPFEALGFKGLRGIEGW